MSAPRMSPTEALMWTVEKDPSLRSDFLNVTLLDGPPDVERLRAKVEQAVELLPRLRQKVVSAPLRLAPPEWVDDPQFDLAYHVRRVGLPAPGGMRQLLDFAASVAADAFDRARPLWQFTVVEGLDSGRAALLQKIHHTVTDGVGGLKLSLALLDLERAPSAGTPNLAGEPHPDDEGGPTRSTPFEVVMETLAYAARRQAETLRRSVDAVGDVVRHPASIPEVAGRVTRTVRSLQQQAFVRGAALSPLMRERSLARHFDTHTVALDDLKGVARAFDVTVNDAFVSGVAGAVGRFHERMGEPVDQLRMAMPVNLRERGEGVGGNHFAPARIVVPVGIKDPVELLAAVAARLTGIRTEPALGMADSVAGVVGLAPTSVLVPLAKAQTRTIDFATSNLRGSPVELFLSGAGIEANYPFGPCTGCAVNVTALSYGGAFDMGVNMDTAAVTDPDAFLECLRESFDALLV